MKRENYQANRRQQRAERHRRTTEILQERETSEAMFSYQWLLLALLVVVMSWVNFQLVIVPTDTTIGTIILAFLGPVILAGMIYATGILMATFVTVATIFLLFTPYTHQLDEIKNLLLATLPPALLGFAVWQTDFSRFRWRTHASSILLGLFGAAVVVSLLFNLRFWLVGERVIWFQLGCMTFTVVFAWFMDSEYQMRRVMTFFVILCFVSTIVGLFLYAGQGFTDRIAAAMARSSYWGPQAKNLVTTLASSKEMYSTILNSDFYAAFLVMTIWLPLAMFFVEEHIGYKILAVATFLLMGVCLVFTYSNDSFGSVVIGLVVFVVFAAIFALPHIREWFSVRLLVTFGIGALILAATILVLMIPKLAQGWAFKTEAYEGRRVLWWGGFLPWLYGEDFTRHAYNYMTMLFGTGPGGYRFYFPVHRRPDYFDNQINNVTTFGHNWYLDVLLEFGALGLVLFLAFMFRVIYDAVQQIRTTQVKSHMLYQIALISGMAGIALQNYFSPNNRWAVCGMIYWAVFGLSMGVHHLDNPGQPAAESERRPNAPHAIVRWALLAVAALFILRSIPQGKEYFQAAQCNGLGLVYMEVADNRGSDKQQYLEESRRQFERAIELNPTFATSYYKLGHVYNQLASIYTDKYLEYVDKAIATYETLHRVNPHYSELHLNLGIMYSAKADRFQGTEREKLMEKAYAEIREAARQAVKPQVQWLSGLIGRQLAAIYEDQGRNNPDKELRSRYQAKAQKVLEEIKENYETILTYQPKLRELIVDRKRYYSRAQQQLVALARQTGKPAEAEAMLRRMFAEDPDRAEYLNGLLAFLDQQGKLKEKVEFLKGASHDDPLDINLRKLLARAQFEAKNMDEFAAELHRIEVLAPKDKEAVSDLYLVYKNAGVADKKQEYDRKLRDLGVDADKLTSWTLSAATATTGSDFLLGTDGILSTELE